MKLNLIDKVFIFIQGNVYLSLQMFFISYKSKTTSFWISLSLKSQLVSSVSVSESHLFSRCNSSSICLSILIHIYYINTILLSLSLSSCFQAGCDAFCLCLSTECRVMKGAKGQRGSAKSPGPIKRSKSPAESSESSDISPHRVVLSEPETAKQTDLTFV